MPMSTIELPRSMVDAVHEYAERERVSVLDFFAAMLKKQYGYVMTVKVDTLPPVKRVRRTRPAWFASVKVDPSKKHDMASIRRSIVKHYED